MWLKSLNKSKSTAHLYDFAEENIITAKNKNIVRPADDNTKKI